MLPSILKHPELRCQAHSRRSNWQQCGRLAAFGSRVCLSHGARRVPRFGPDAPRFQHGNRSLEATTKASQAIKRLRLLAVGVKALDGDKSALKAFTERWEPLLERQAAELVSLRKRMKR